MEPGPKKILVTGGAGFIGSHLADCLCAGGAEVTVFDDLSTGSLANLEDSMAGTGGIRFIQGDVRDFRALEKAAVGADVVFHLAAVVSVPLTVKDPLGTALVNEGGTLNVFEASRAAGVKRVVFASSCAVYGEAPGLPKEEGMDPEPASPYALQKYIGERYARLYSSIYGIQATALRFFNVFGPRQDPSSDYSGVISIFLERALKGEGPVIYGDGLQYRDFVYVDDVVGALIAAAGKEVPGNVYNVATGKYVTIKELWERIAGVSGSKASPEYRGPRKGDVRESAGEVSRIKRDLGWTPGVSFEKGLEITYKWYKVKADAQGA